MDYKYTAKVLKINDGDTIKVSIRLKKTRMKAQDLGCDIFVEDGYLCRHIPLRFMGINAPEHGSQAGDAATAWLKGMLKIGDVINIKTIRDETEKYGRLLAYITRTGETITLNQQEVAAGFAFEWDGRGAKPVA